MKPLGIMMKKCVALALTLSVGCISLGCLTICAAHAEQSSFESGETCFTMMGAEDDCCSLNALRSMPPDRIQKSPIGIIARSLPPASVFCFHKQNQSVIRIATSTQPTCSPPLQRNHALRI